jgi:eukaryotic-like serine/threonine-protein kinase
VRIQRAATSETESLGSLTAEVLNDVALTQKLLRMVNSAQFKHAGGGTIATVSRAVALVGFAGVRNLALSLVLLEHMQNKQHASSLKEEFLRALMAGTLAGALAPLARESEEVFIGAMFQNLGRLLTEFYFPEEALQIRQQGAEGASARDGAAQRVLGIGYDELGVGVAKSWGLPDGLQRCMRAPPGELPSRAVDRGADRQRWLARCANELTDTLLDAPDALPALAQSCARALGLDPKDVTAATETAKVRLAEFARTMGLVVPKASTARRLLPADAPSLSDSDEATIVVPASGSSAQPAAAVAATSAAGPRRADSDVLTAGIADLTQTLASDEYKLNDVLRMVLETIYRGLGVQRLVFCLRDPRAEALVGRMALGVGGDAASKAFHIPLRTKPGVAPDLFAALCIKGADTLIADASRGGIAAKLPPWYRRAVDAPTFLLLPLSLRGAPFGLIYADAATAGGIELNEKELSLLRALRNQAVMAFRQKN